MKLKGSICITRPSYSDGRKCMSITCEDESTGIRFLEVEVPYDEFVMALTSSNGAMKYELRGWMHLGKTKEIKREKVWVPDVGWSLEAREKAARKAVAAAETDGWRGHVSDAMNSHRRVPSSDDGGEWYSVSFHRYVEKLNEAAE